MAGEVLKAIRLVILITLFSLLFGEAGARILGLSPRPTITLNTCTGYLSVPNMQGYAPGPNGLIPVSINSAGFRDTEHEVGKKESTYRVLFLGDSFTEALQVPINETFTSQLQQRADEAHLPLEIITMGVSSFGTGQELRAYECYGRQYRPDLVVLTFVNGHDLLDNYFRTDPFTPTYSIVDGKLFLDTEYQNRIKVRLDAKNSLVKGSLYAVKDNSALARYLLLTYQNTRAGDTLSTSGGIDEPVFLQEYAKEYPADWENAWKLTELIIATLAKETHEDGARLLLVQLPSLEQLEPERVANPERFDFEKPTKRLSTIAQALRIPVLNLHVPFSESSDAKSLHFTDDLHLTKKGHGVVAGVLFNEITAKYLPKE